MFDSPFLTPATTLPFWYLVTRLGEATILLPTAGLALAALARHGAGRALALWWLGAISAAALLTTTTKLAFIGWGLGWPAVDFTGVSGHAMFAAAIYPLLFGTVAPGRRLYEPAPRLPGQLAPSFPYVPTWRWVGVAAGVALAVLVGVSRAMVNAHSVSEVMAGLALGGIASALAVWRAGLPGGRISLWVPALAVAWLAATPAYAPPSPTHEVVTQLALKLAGRQQPYMREPWLREWRSRNLL